MDFFLSCRMNVKLFAFSAVLFLGLFAGRTAQADTVTYQVTVNTALVANTNGFLDFQFNPGGLGAQSASIQVTNFQFGGTLSNPSQNSGGAVGSLPAVVTINNTTGFNDLFQGALFGNDFSFALTINTSGAVTGVGNAFGLSLFAADQVTPLLTTDVNATILTFLANGNGSIGLPQTFDNGHGGGPVVTFGPPPATTAEPTSLLLLALGLVCIAVKRRNFNSWLDRRVE